MKVKTYQGHAVPDGDTHYISAKKIDCAEGFYKLEGNILLFARAGYGTWTGYGLTRSRMMPHAIELPEEEVKPEIKPDSRINIIGQNGNDGEHYEELERNKSKYHREIKSGVFVDVYNVLMAFGVTNPAMQHALKKMLAPGQRGVKDTIQDMKEAIQSIERAIELEQAKGDD